MKQLQQREEDGRPKQEWKEHTTEEREVIRQSDIDVITMHEALNSGEPLLGELPELPPADQDPSIYTRQRDPFKPERVAEII
jgi:hypothetical protein